MKKVSFILLVFMFMVSFLSARAQEKKEEVPEDTQVIEVGPGSRLLLPKGMKIEKTGSQITIEDFGQYYERRLKEMEERLAEFRSRDEILQKEIEQLQEGLTEMQNKLAELQKEKK